MKDIEINRNNRNYKFFEILPGMMTWSIFIISFILSLFFPYVFAVLIIIYATYWLVKAFVMSARLTVGYKNYKKDIAKNWKNMIIDLQSKELEIGTKDIYHLVVMATYKESFKTLDYSIEAIAKSNYDLKKIIVVLATEERAGEIGKINAKKLVDKYKNIFYNFSAVCHPMNLPKEIKGKGANITYATKKIISFIQKNNISSKNVLVTTLDADHRPHKDYFSALTYSYLTTKDPIHKSYQPLPMFFNNIWDVPIPIRSISIGSSFWQMIESTRPYRLRNFAAHAQSLETLVQTNFWSKLTIVEDGHQFWRSYFAFDGNHEVIPINIPIYQDAVLSPKGLYMTFVEQYLQKKRWAWGASDIPYAICKFIEDKKISLWEKITQTSRLIEGHISWSTTSVILFFAGWLPVILNPSFSKTVVAFNFPYVYSRILTIAMVGMVITLSISTLMLPPKPKKKFNFSILLEWLLTPFMLPISNILFSSIPAIHAQTLLMFGKYMDFHVTDKKAIKYKHTKK